MFNKLPDEIVCQVASFLSLRELMKFSMVNCRIYALLMEDEDCLDVLWESVAQSIHEQFFWMFGSKCPLQVTSGKSKLIEKIEDVDDDDIMINSPLKSSSVLKFKKPLSNFCGKMIKITPRALISKMVYLHGLSNNYGAAKIDESIIKKMADLITYDSITLSMWFRMEENCEGGVLFGVQNREFSSGDAFVPVIYLTYNLGLRATFWGANAISYSGFPEKKWHHVALTKHLNEQKLYFNGELVNKSVSSRFTHHEHKLHYGQLGSGLCDRWPEANMNYSCNCSTLSGGKIADVTILDKALNEEELKQLMIDSKFITPVAHWDFIQDNNIKILGSRRVLNVETDFEGFVQINKN